MDAGHAIETPCNCGLDKTEDEFWRHEARGCKWARAVVTAVGKAWKRAERPHMEG